MGEPVVFVSRGGEVPFSLVSRSLTLHWNEIFVEKIRISVFCDKNLAFMPRPRPWNKLKRTPDIPSPRNKESWLTKWCHKETFEGKLESAVDRCRYFHFKGIIVAL